MNIDFLPAQFMNYLLVPNQQTGKNDKLPCNAAGVIADAHAPSNWIDYAAAAKAVSDGRAAGIAFVLTANDPFFFIDLDNCRDGAGNWTNEAVAIFQTFSGAMAEISQSGRGLHILGKCRPDQLQDRRNKFDGWKEFYTQGRFIAFGSTGWEPIGGTLRLDLDWTDTLRRVVPERPLLGELPEGVDPAYTGPQDDDVLIAKMLASKGGAAGAFGIRATVKMLWEADPVLAQFYPDFGGDKTKFDNSAADAALMAHLAFWTGKDMPRMDRLFRRSALMRPKFERDDYRLKTVQDAARMCNRVYDKVKPPGQTMPNPSTSEVYLNVPEMEQHFAGCVYIRELHRVMTPDGDLLKPDQFKSYYGGHIFQMNPDGTYPEKNAFVAFTENRTIRFPKVKKGVFDPQCPSGQIVNDTVNTYVDPGVVFTPGDVGPFLDLLHKLVPNERDRAILLAWCASAVQNPGKKFQWAPVLQGMEGNGKTFIANCVAAGIGEVYTHRPTAAHMNEKFNSYLERSLLVIVEEVHAQGKREMMDLLKPMVTNEWLEIRGMQQDKRMARNYTKWIFCTNYQDAIIKSTTDRRYAIIFTAQQFPEDLVRDGMDGAYFPDLYDWARNRGGYSAVAHYLKTYPIPAELDPAGLCHRAPVTTATNAAIEKSTGAIEAVVIEASENGTLGFRGGMLSSWSLEKLMREHNLKLALNKRGGMLETMGFVNCGRAKGNLAWEGGTRPLIYARRGVNVGSDPTETYLRAQGYVR